MLTATEKQRITNFTRHMDKTTAGAMYRLFELTKPGCDEAANNLFLAAHGIGGNAVSDPARRVFVPLGLVNKDGLIPKSIAAAIRKAVREFYLTMHGPDEPALKWDVPDVRYW